MVNKQRSSKYPSTHSMTSLGLRALVRAIPLLQTVVELCQTLFVVHVFTYMSLYIFLRVVQNSMHALSRHEYMTNK